MGMQERPGMLSMIADIARDGKRAGHGGGPGRRVIPTPGPSLTAAAIAAGLVALWVALSLLAAG